VSSKSFESRNNLAANEKQVALRSLNLCVKSSNSSSASLQLPAVKISLQIPGSRGLRRGSAVARLLGLRVRIPLGHESLSHVSVVCCQVEVSASD
jgi:hypothetical protein